MRAGNSETFSCIVSEMKRVSWLLIFAVGLSGCDTPGDSLGPSDGERELQVDSNVSAETGTSDEPSADLEAVGGIEVEKNIFDVSITLPPDLAGVSSQGEVDSAVSDGGYSSGSLNADGSVTYQIPSDVHAELMAEMRIAVEETADQVVADEPQIYKSITFDDSVEIVEVVVNRAEYENSFSFVAFTLYLAVGFYHVFSGVEDIQPKVRFIDEATGAVFDEYDPSDE